MTRRDFWRSMAAVPAAAAELYAQRTRALPPLTINPTSAPPLTGGIGFRAVLIQAAMQLLRFQS